MQCPHCAGTIPVYKNPTPTVDIIIETPGGIVLIERKNPPYGWALPGGFVDYGESFEDAARREAKEEVNLDVELIMQLHTYSNPQRDPRQHTCSTVFLARADGNPVGADDALTAQAFPLLVDQHQEEQNLPPLAFDHGKILADYMHFKRTGKLPGFE